MFRGGIMTLREKTRVARRAAGIAAWTFLLVAARIAVRPWARIFPAREAAWRSALLRAWGRGLLACGGVQLRVRGMPPHAPFFLVSNHLSSVDQPVLAAATGCVFVSRADVARWPALGFVVRAADTVFIDRSDLRETLRVNAELGKRLDRGYGIHVFPESRISVDGTVKAFRPALLETAVARGMPVHYAAIQYRTPDGSPSVRDSVIWGPEQTFAQSMGAFLRLPYCEATLVFGPAPIQDADRKRLAQALHDAVAAQLDPAQ